MPDGTVFVSGREHDGQDGYWVVTPLTVDGADGSALPVVRGWVADPAEAPAPPTGAASLDAWLQPPEGTGEVDDDPDDDVLPQLRIADVIQHVDQDLYGAYGVATEPEDGLEHASVDQLPDVGTFTGDPQPALCDRVVVLRAVRRLHLVALGDGDRSRGGGRRGPRRGADPDP